MSHPLVRAKLQHFADRGKYIKGVVHVGANDGEEIEWYLHQLWTPIWAIEPLPRAYDLLVGHYGSHPEVVCSNFALGNQNGLLPLYEDLTGTGKGTAAGHTFPTEGHDWTVTRPYAAEPIHVPSFRADSIDWPVRATEVNALVVDAEGMELKVLQGFGESLQYFSYLNIECSERPTYRDQAPAQEVVDFLAARGFRQDSPIQTHDDIFFVKEGA